MKGGGEDQGWVLRHTQTQVREPRVTGPQRLASEGLSKGEILRTTPTSRNSGITGNIPLPTYLADRKLRDSSWNKSLQTSSEFRAALRQSHCSHCSVLLSGLSVPCTAACNFSFPQPECVCLKVPAPVCACVVCECVSMLCACLNHVCVYYSKLKVGLTCLFPLS